MGKSGSSSQANQQTTSSNTDKRIVNESGVVATDSWLDLSSTMNTSLTSFDSSNRSTNLTTVDGSNRSTNLNAVDSHNTSTWSSLTNNSTDNSNTSTVTGSFNTTLDPQVAKAALDFASNNDATLGDGFSALLGFAKELTTANTNSTNNLVGRFTDGVAQAFDSARNTTPGGIDNKTMVILGVAGAAAVALIAMKGKN